MNTRSVRPRLCRWLHGEPQRVIAEGVWCWQCQKCDSTWAILGGQVGNWRPERDRPVVDDWRKEREARAAKMRMPDQKPVLPMRKRA